MSPRGLILILSTLLLGMLSSPARGDGGALCLIERLGGYQVSVFTAPNPLRAGPIDVSVLVQDAQTGRSVKDAEVVVTLTSAADPAASILGRATVDAATNKLLRAALLELPAEGTWDVAVACDGPQGQGTVRFAVQAAGPLPPWLTEWPWFGWPMGVVVLFGTHRYLVWRRRLTLLL